LPVLVVGNRAAAALAASRARSLCCHGKARLAGEMCGPAGGNCVAAGLSRRAVSVAVLASVAPAAGGSAIPRGDDCRRRVMSAWATSPRTLCSGRLAGRFIAPLLRMANPMWLGQVQCTGSEARPPNLVAMLGRRQVPLFEPSCNFLRLCLHAPKH
jgi:hypothetical protein